MDFNGTFPPKANEAVGASRMEKKQPSPDSFNEEDPLSAPSSQFGIPSHHQHSTPGKSRIAVVFSGSPRHHVTSSAHVESEGVAPLVVSDLSGQGRQYVSTVTPAAPTAALVPSAEAPAAIPRPLASAGRGRPKGWKPGMRYSEMRGHPPGSRVVRQTAGTMKRRGRPPKQPSPPPVAIYGQLKPDFLAYLCEWTGCKAELHNLGTLRRHLYVVHGNNDTCLWAECKHTSPAQVFSSSEDFKRHMEEAHLVPMGWHVGDGPLNNRMATKTKDEAVPSFLKDKDGQQVTPSVADQEVEDMETWKNNRRKLKELLKRRNEQLPDDESDDGVAEALP